MSVTREEIIYALSPMASNDFANGTLREAYRESIEALIQTKLTLERHQRWTGQAWEQNHIADFEARKILDQIRPIIDKYPEE